MTDLNHLVAQLAQQATAVKPAPHPYRLSLQWIGAGAFYLAVTLALSGLRPQLTEHLSQFWFAAELVALLAIFILTSLSAALLAFPDLHQKRRLTYAPVVVFLLFLFILIGAWNADTPPAPHPAHDIECTLSILLTMLLPAAWTFRAMRQYASTHYHLAGGITLLSAFSLGALWLRLHETNDSIGHVVEWHYLPMLGIGLLGLWLGKMWLKW